MKNIRYSGMLILMFAVFIGSGCSGGGGDSSPAQPTTAVVKILSSGSLASGVKIGGIDVTLVLPTGVTVKATADSTNPAVLVTNSGVVAASGVAAGANTLSSATYKDAAGGTPGKVMVHMANPDGFSTGEFVTINCVIAAGSFPTAADFSPAGFAAFDLNGATISGLTAGLTADIR